MSRLDARTDGALAALTRDAGIPVVHDLGSGLLIDAARLGLPDEPTPRDAQRGGASLVTGNGGKYSGAAGTAPGTGREGRDSQVVGDRSRPVGTASRAVLPARDRAASAAPRLRSDTAVGRPNLVACSGWVD